MHITKDYIELQVNFTKKLCEIDNMPFGIYFMLYTDAPLMLKINYKTWHPNNLEYLEFEKAIKASTDLTNTIFDYVMKKEQQNPTEIFLNNPYGFFYSKIASENKLELHTLSEVPLNKDAIHFLDHRKLEETKQDLYRMIKDKKEKFPEIKFVIGNSWLYNLEAYKRLFPKEYLETSKPNTNTFHGYALWGQFLNKQLEVKPNLKEDFYTKLNKAKTFEECMEAFPYKVLSLKSGIGVFLK